MNIIINTNLIETLERLAEERGVTTQEYLENYINSHLVAQYKSFIIGKIQVETLENLPLLDSAIMVQKNEIKVAKDLINPPVVELI